MLVLTRYVNQSVYIGDREVVVKVLDVKGGKVKLGFAAADDIPINREEVFEKIKKEESKEIENIIDKLA
jgi:carbon storage regulator